MSTGTISDATLTYFDEKRVRALLDEAMRDVLMALPDDPLLFLERALSRPTPLRIIITGLPGSGKGTQCARLAGAFNLRHISAGDILRRVAESGEAVAVQIAMHIGEGSLVPDDLFVDLVVAEVRAAEEADGGWVLEGFPRTRAQAIYLQAAGISPQRFLFVDVPQEACAARVLARAKDSAHMRADDTPECLRIRLSRFAAREQELLDCYQPFYARVEGDVPEDEAFAELCAQCDAIDIAK